jgi:hypothetical protein
MNREQIYKIQMIKDHIIYQENEIDIAEQRIRAARVIIREKLREIQGLETTFQCEALWAEIDPKNEIRELIEFTVKRIEDRPSMIGRQDHRQASNLKALSKGILDHRLREQQEQYPGCSTLLHRNLLYMAGSILKNDPANKSVPVLARVWKLFEDKNKETEAYFEEKRKQS